MDAFELVARLVLDTADVVTKLNAAATTGKFSAWGVTVGNLASQAFSRAFSAASGFARSIVMTGMDFDSMMSEVKSVGNLTQQQFDAVRQSALDYGATTKFTAKEVGSAFYFMGLAGWNAEEMLQGVGGVLDLAAASGEDLGHVSDIVTDAITALGLKASNTAEFVNVLAAAATNSNTTVSQMGEAFKYLATTGGVMEYSMQDVATTLGLLANNGIKASQAGTSMRQILNTLIAPSEKASQAMNAIGLSLFEIGTGKRKPLMQVVEELRQIFKEADFNLEGKEPTEEVLAKIEELTVLYDSYMKAVKDGKTITLNPGTSVEVVLKDMYAVEAWYREQVGGLASFNEDFLSKLSSIGGLRGISSLFALMKSTDDDVNQLMTSIEKSSEGEGAAKTMAETMIDNLEGDITLLNSALDGLKIIVSDKFKDNLREGTQALTGWITAISNLIENGPGDTIERAQRKENEAITEANKTANEAQGIVGYMDELIAKFGDAATKTNEWEDALNNLNKILPGISDHIKAEGEALGSTTDKMREYIEQSRQRATMEAKRKTIGTYEEAYANALAGVQGAQVAVDIARQQQAYAADQIMDILRKYRTGQGAEFSEETEQLYRKMIQEGGTNKLRSDILYAGQELGKSYEELDALMQSYDTARQAEETNAAQIDALTTEMERTSAALEIAQAALAEMETDTTQAGLNELASAASGLAGRLNSVVVPSFAGFSNQTYAPKAKGDWYVPYDNYAALLHRGEMVLTASQARRYREGEGYQVDMSALQAAIVGAVQQGMANAQIDAFIDGRRVTDEVSRRLNTEIGLRR